MTTAASQFLTAFDALPLAQQHEVAIEILRRTATNEDIPEAALEQVAGELFDTYDAEEAANGESSAR